MDFKNSLYNLSLNKLCSSFDNELFKYLLEYYPKKLAFEILYKAFNINIDTSQFDERLSRQNGKEIVKAKFIKFYRSQTIEIDKKLSLYLERHLKYVQNLQPKERCILKVNFYDIFDLDFFFKFIDYSDYKAEFFAIFKICIEMTNTKFPKQLAEKWLDNETQKNNVDETVKYIDQGLKLGIFLYDSGWFIESALILSRTHQIIIEKWVYPNQNMMQTKTVQCLTALLLALSDSYNFVEAKNVLKFILDIIKSIEETENTTCLAHAYLAISQYHYVIMEFKKAMSWAAKAILELDDTTSDDLKFLVVNHAIRVCSVTNRRILGVALINQLNSCDKTIYQNVYLNFLLNKAFFYRTAYNKIYYNFYIPLDITFRTFGYLNLKTASVLVDYAYAIYFNNYGNKKYQEGLSSILQAIFIMRRIGLPKDHMLVLNANRLKALLFEGYSDNNLNRANNYEMKKNYMLGKAYSIHSKTLNYFKRINGNEDTLYVAESYFYLGRICQHLAKYRESQLKHVQAIRIKIQLLGVESPEVAWSLYFLANLYLSPPETNLHLEAQKLLLKSIKTYEENGLKDMYHVQSCYQRLSSVYTTLNDPIKANEYSGKYWLMVLLIRDHFHSLNNAHIDEEDSSVETINLESIRSLLSEYVLVVDV